MDVGATNGWRMDEVVPSQDLVSLIHAAHPIAPLGKHYAGEVAERWQYDDAQAGWGEVGFISSVTQPFCSDCSRLRLSTNGQLFTCLFAQQGWDVRSLLRDASVDDAQIAGRFAAMWQQRSDQYSALRTSLTNDIPKVEMSFIGG
jgi:GTP 3',8-cyclase